MGATDLDTWADYVTVINAERLNNLRNSVIANENNISSVSLLYAANSSSIALLNENKLNRSGDQHMWANLNLSWHLVVNSTTPTLYHHLTNKSYVDNVRDNISSTLSSHIADATMNTDADVSGNTWVLNEDDMASDSDVKVSTQQSIKAYADTKLPLAGGVMTGTLDLNGMTLTVDAAGVYSIAEGIGPSVSINADGSPLMRIRSTAIYNDVVTKVDQIDENTNGVGVTIDGVVCKDGKTSDVKSMAFHLGSEADNTTVWLLGGGTADTVMTFNQTIKLKDYRYTMLSSKAKGRFDVFINNKNEVWTNQSSHTSLDAGGHMATISLSNTYIPTSNGIQMTVINASNVSYLTLLLNYE